MSAPQSHLPAYAAAVLGIALFSIMDMVMKGLALAIGTFPTLLWRSLIGIAMASIPFLIARNPWPRGVALRLHLLRGTMMVPMAILFFWGLARVPMAQAVALTFIAPLIALVLAAAILKEPIGKRTVGGSLAAFAGVVVIFAGQAQADLGPPALLGSFAILASAVIYAFNIIVMRRQAQHAGPVEIAFFQNLVIGGTLLLWAAVSEWPPLPSGHWGELVLAASLAIGSLMLLGWGYARAGAAYLSTTEYTSFLWAMLLGWLRFGESVSLFTMAGASLIVAGCLMAARTRKVEHPALEATA
ncbi:DMT family transporter [Sphingomonas sp. RB56-2]|uniref:DMT family transporter n=1 Tax=Sphingomonas brevis TaxID=2908206 RepID=A0ABT0SAR2_9SPHN|nr:DMT family transporter [Sphingomonas brevis]MCL6741499.1 DMT family transporter [Sphingomonas brevis]